MQILKHSLLLWPQTVIMMRVPVSPQILALMVHLVGLQLLQLLSNVRLMFVLVKILTITDHSFFYIVFLLFFIGTEYNSDLSCHYKVELSYENLVTSGPDSHPPPIADDESDDEDDDDAPRVNTVLACLNEVEQMVLSVFYFF